MSAENEATTPRRSVSCATCFDNLWFCYSPVHQMQQYYRLGVLDNCSDKWSALVDCLTLKTKRSSEMQEYPKTSISDHDNIEFSIHQEILETREKAKPHIWTIRTPEEASAHWKELFGDTDGME